MVHDTNVLLCGSISDPDNGFSLQVRQWNIWGLPKDDLSTENAIAIDVGECEAAALLPLGWLQRALLRFMPGQHASR